MITQKTKTIFMVTALAFAGELFAAENAECDATSLQVIKAMNRLVRMDIRVLKH